MTVQEIWALGNFYNSVFSGEQIDEAIGIILNGGIDAAVLEAEAAAAAAAKSAQEAAGSAAGLGDAATNAKNSATQAAESAEQARIYAEHAHAIAGENIVTSVNGVFPDSVGNVVIDTGGVASVNGVVPDEDGNINLDANDLGALAKDAFIDWFGTGISIPNGDDLDDYTVPGKYYCGSASGSNTLLNCPVSNDNFAMLVFKRTSGASINQLIITLNSAIFLRGCSSNGVLRDWQNPANLAVVKNLIAALTAVDVGAAPATESAKYSGCYYRTVDGVTEWINPPMVEGVEYATTERSNGSVVYAKRIEHTFSATIGSDTGSGDTSIPHGIVGFGMLLRCNGTPGSYCLPYFTSSGGVISLKQVDATNIVLRYVNASMSARTFYFDVYYTKG